MCLSLSSQRSFERQILNERCAVCVCVFGAVWRVVRVLPARAFRLACPFVSKTARARALRQHAIRGQRLRANLLTPVARTLAPRYKIKKQRCCAHAQIAKSSVAQRNAIAFGARRRASARRLPSHRLPSRASGERVQGRRVALAINSALWCSFARACDDAQPTTKHNEGVLEAKGRFIS